MESFYYVWINDVLGNGRPHGEKFTVLNRFKAKIVKLHSDSLKTVMIDNSETDILDGEEKTPFHIFQM